MQAKLTQQRIEITRPADGDGGGGGKIFEHQIPADDPGEESSHGRIGVGIGAYPRTGIMEANSA